VAGSSFPRTAQAIDAAWLTSALREHGDLPVGEVSACAVEVLDAKSATGQLVRLRLAYEGAGALAPSTLIAKLASADPNVRRAAARSYAKELCFYRDIGHDAGVGVPRCYGFAHDEASAQLILLLEDLAEPVLERPRIEVARKTVEEIASFHAKHWRSARLSLPWLQDDASIREYCAVYAQAVPALRAALGTALPETFAAVAERSARDLRATFRAMHAAPPTLIHGDLHLQQVYWAGSGRFAVLDWQTVMVGSAVTDVSRVLVSSTEPQAQAAHELQILHAYHQSLVARGIADYAFDDLLEDYRRSILHSVFVHTIGAFQLDLSRFQRRSAEQGRAWTERFFGWVDAALVRHDVLQRIAAWLP
jgi:aminoglycoside/choline kinase family phosphotransferase